MPDDLIDKIRTCIDGMLMSLHGHGYSVEVQRDSAMMEEPPDDPKRTCGEILRHTVGGHPLPASIDRVALVAACRELRDGIENAKRVFSILDDAHNKMIATPKKEWKRAKAPDWSKPTRKSDVATFLGISVDTIDRYAKEYPGSVEKVLHSTFLFDRKHSLFSRLP